MSDGQPDLSAPAEGPQEPPRRSWTDRNYVLGVLNGTIGSAAYDFIHPELILTGFIFALARQALGDSWAMYLAALLSIINKAAALLPQLYVSSLLEHRARKRPFYMRLVVLRLTSAGVMLWSMWMLSQRVDAAGLVLFFTAFLMVSYCMGAGHVVALDLFARMIPRGRIGSFLGARESSGSILSFILGLVLVQPVLERARFSTDTGVLAQSYFWVALAGTLLTAMSMMCLVLCREEPGPRARRRGTMVESLIRGWRWLKRNPDYRAYLWLRIAFRINILGLAFFIPFGEQTLGSSAGAGGVVLLGGVFISTLKLSRAPSSTLWGWIVDRYGDRACLIGTGAAFTVGPALMLVAARLPRVFEFRIPLTAMVLDLRLLVYLLALVVIGTALQGSVIGGNRFLMGRAPPRRRLSYIGFLNTVTAPLTLIPAAAAVVADVWGVEALFVGIVMGGLLYLGWAMKVRPESAYAGQKIRATR